MRYRNYFLLFLLAAILPVSGQKIEVLLDPAFQKPVIDGVEEQVWENVEKNYLEKFFQDETPTVTAYWKGLFDDTCFYFLVNVQDDHYYPAWKAQGNPWDYDIAQIYFDVNDTIEDGLGPENANSGHWQCADGFAEDGYNIEQYFEHSAWPGHNPDYYAACSFNDENYVIEYRIPFSSLADKYGRKLNKFTISSRIGFDVTVIDQDSGMTSIRQRAVWQNDGKSGGMTDSWYNMDACGVLTTLFHKDTIHRDTVLALIKYENIKRVNIYPNPVQDELVVELEINHPQVITIELYNLLGEKLYEFSSGQLIDYNFRHVIHVGQLKNITGINLLKVHSGGDHYLTKIIKN